VQPKDNLPATTTERYWFWALAAFCCFMVFQNLGAAHLFEPDEGRNAERARELLLLNNWAIPHENFLPALDKTIFLYWLIAIAYKCFGVSEWSARLPSALAALGCLLLVYRFACDRWGNWVALWSTLILLTNLQFFFYSRLVIFDMTLAFFTTLALIEYTRRWRPAIHTLDHATSLMSAAMGLATLVKGPIGVVLPGMVIFLYVVSPGWSFLTWRNLLLGGSFSAPSSRPGPGGRKRDIQATCAISFGGKFCPLPYAPFQADRAWYYYILVVACGFFPESLSPFRG
jgi:4-amino-4-deoxy-L-arabinose transferase-like glycosyltransferase